ncbi:MAG: hypothetical protein JSV08_03870, partial [Acidobacteriota bacterium]
TDSAVPACSDTTVPGTTVTVNPLPTPVILETCGVPNSTLDAGAGYASYSWTSVPPGEPGDGATTQTVQVPCNSTGSYTVTVEDGNNCFGTSPAEDVTNCTCPCITSATATALGPTTFCEGGSVDLVATPDDGLGPFTYLWSPGGETTQTVTVGVADTYFCDVTDTDPGCGNTVTSNSIVVTVNPLPTPVITETCAAPLDSTLDAGAGYVSYSWSTTPPGGPGDGATTQTIQVPCDTTETYTVTVEDGNNCFGTSPSEAVCGCGAAPPDEPSDAPPYLKIANAAGTQVDVEDESGSGATAYVVYENPIGTFYGTPGQSGCLVPIGAGAEPGTVRLNYDMGAPDVWIVVTAANAAGESSAGRSWDSAAGYVERRDAGWPPEVNCP